MIALNDGSRFNRKMSSRSTIIAAISLFFLLVGMSHAQAKPKAKPTPKPAAKPAAPQAAKPAASAPVKCLTNGLTDAEAKELVDGHNRERKVLGLKEMVWDCTLANFAQDWANQNIFGHSNTAYGENMFVSSESTATVGSVIDRWLAERANWNNTAGTCAAGKVCTHYTQMVWRTTTKIGCGVNRNATGKWKAVLVCNYDPASLSSGPAY